MNVRSTRDVLFALALGVALALAVVSGLHIVFALFPPEGMGI